MGPNFRWTPNDVNSALDRRDALKVANAALQGLAVEEEMQPVEMQQLQGAELDVIQAASVAMGWDETQENDLLSSYLSAGGTDIDPDQTAWCAAFVNAALAHSGMNGTGMLNARSFLDWGQEVSEPVKGDVVVLSRGNNPAQGHVGFFMGFDDQGNIMLLGGNQGDAVNIKTYSKDRLLGYRRADGQPMPVSGTEQEVRAISQVQRGLYGGNPVVANQVDLDVAPVQPVAPEGASLDEEIANAELATASVLRETDPEEAVEPSQGSRGRRERRSREMTQSSIQEMVEKILSPKQKRQVRAAGFNPDEVEFFATEEEAEQALERGEVPPGTLYVNGEGNIFILE